jgi:hypothetical protein
MLRAGGTAVAPVIPGVTFQDDSDAFTASPPAPEADQSPVTSMSEAPGPEVAPPPPEQVAAPDPVYPGIVVVKSPRNAPARNDKPPSQPVQASVQPAPQPFPPRRIPAPPSHLKHPMDREEIAIYEEVIKDVRSDNSAKAIQDLDTWSKRFPDSDLQNDRLYLYMQSYSRVKPPQPAKVVECGAQLMSPDVKTALSEPESILAVLYLMTVSVGNIPNPSREVRALGRRAALELVNYVPEFFTPGRKPANTSDADWEKAFTDMEAVARQAVATLETRR